MAEQMIFCVETNKKADTDFRRKGMIANVDAAKLKAEHPRKNSSNILGVLDQHLQRKV